MLSDEIPDKVYAKLAQARELQEALLDYLRMLFETTRHPFDVWKAYAICRVFQLPPPEWILREFDAISQRLARHAPEAADPDRIAHDDRWYYQVAEIFGFSHNPKGGQADPIARWKRHSRDFEYACAVNDLMQAGHNETDAIYLVAQQHPDVSETTVRSAWLRFEPWLVSLSEWVPPLGDA